MPTIVAEDLVLVDDPITSAIELLPHAAPGAVVAALVRAVAPAREQVEAPAWLRERHHETLRELVGAIARFGGALLADPVGSGKTYVALAVARAGGTGRVTCIVPSIVAGQWRSVAATVGVDVDVVTHERLSRGPIPPIVTGLTIVDESHRFREPGTRRYGHLADAVLHSRVLLLSATPIVNRIGDLSAQLLLGIPDDALASHGVESIADRLAAGETHAAFGRIVFAHPELTAHQPLRNVTTYMSNATTPLLEWLADLDALAISTSPPVAALLRGAFLRSLASSPASFAASLDRYRALLAHHADAAAVGRTLSRGAVLRATMGLDPQLLMWSLLPDADAPSDLATDDPDLLTRLSAKVRAVDSKTDPRMTHLRAQLADHRPTIIFTTFRATVRWLRDALGTTGIAWCTGSSAGIGRMRLPRGAVLELFRTDSAPGAPSVLIASDVAAEGLDLRRVQRVVHWDLPWTPARLEQRDGRALRAGVRHRQVDVLRFDPPAAVESRLRIIALLESKARLPAIAGLQIHDDIASWRTLGALCRQLRGPGAPTAGAACVGGGANGMLAAFAAGPEWLGVVWIADDGSISDDANVLAHQLSSATTSAHEPLAFAQRAGVQAISASQRHALGCAWQRFASTRLASEWARPALSAGARRLCQRLDHLARQAHSERDPISMATVETLRQFASRGHTAGEARMAEAIALDDHRAARRAASRLPKPRVVRSVQPIALVALLVVRAVGSE